MSGCKWAPERAKGTKKAGIRCGKEKLYKDGFCQDHYYQNRRKQKAKKAKALATATERKRETTQPVKRKRAAVAAAASVREQSDEDGSGSDSDNIDQLVLVRLAAIESKLDYIAGLVAQPSRATGVPVRLTAEQYEQVRAGVQSIAQATGTQGNALLSSVFHTASKPDASDLLSTSITRSLSAEFKEEQGEFDHELFMFVRRAVDGKNPVNPVTKNRPPELTAAHQR